MRLEELERQIELTARGVFWQRQQKTGQGVGYSRWACRGGTVRVKNLRRHLEQRR